MTDASRAWEVSVDFPPDDPVYCDHFPGMAVVPGSLVVHAALSHGGLSASAPLQLKRFRFHRFLSPGCYRFSFRCVDRTLSCEVFRDDACYARGAFLLP